MNVKTLMKGIKVVAFDIDGTLADVDDIVDISDNYVFNLVKKEYPLIKMTTYYQVTKFLTNFHGTTKHPALSIGAHRHSVYQEMAVDAGYPVSVGDELFQSWQYQRNHFNFYPFAVKLMHYLHDNGYRVITITDGSANFSFHPEVDGIIDMAISPMVNNCTKIDGSAYSFAMKALGGVKACECLMVGDNPVSDIVNAANSGWKTIFITQCVTTFKEKKPDLIVSNVGELLSMLNEMNKSCVC